MSSEYSEKGRVVIIDIEGKLNSETAQALESNIDSLIQKGRQSIILNAENLTFITSRGFGALLYAAHKINEKQGAIAITALNKEIESLFGVLNLTRFLNIYPTKQEALDSFKQSLFPAQSTTPQFSTEEIEEPSGSRFSIDETAYADFAKPLIIECSNCGSLVRVYRAGDYICPACKSEFQVDNEGSAIF